MRKAPKIMLITAAALIGTGTVLSCGAWAVAGFDTARLSTVNYDWHQTVSALEDEATSPHKSIVITSEFENVLLEPADGDAIEAEGIRRSWKKLEEAGLVLAVFDLAAPLNEEDLEIARRCQGRPALAILNKQDLAGQGEAFTAAQQQLAPYFKAIIPLTARDAASLQPLCQAVAQLLGTANLDPNAAALCSARQLSAAKEARDALAEALNSQEDGFGLDAAGVCISDAQRALARLTGEDATEATIDEVFSTFCVGK